MSHDQVLCLVGIRQGRGDTSRRSFAKPRFSKSSSLVSAILTRTNLKELLAIKAHLLLLMDLKRSSTLAISYTKPQMTDSCVLEGFDQQPRSLLLLHHHLDEEVDLQGQGAALKLSVVVRRSLRSWTQSSAEALQKF